MNFSFTVLKDSDAQLDYTFDWSIWLALGDTIASSAWIMPPQLTLVSSTYTGTTTTAWIKGGVNGQTYLVTNRVTTANSPNRIEDRTLQIQMQQR